MSKLHLHLVWMVIFALLTSTLSAQTAAVGIVHPQGGVTVNGRAVSGTTSLFVGETLETGAQGSVMITASGVNLALGPNGSVRMQAGRIELGCGSFAAVDASSAISVGTYNIAPTTGRMRIELAQGARLIVTSRGAAVTISGGPAVHNVAAGGSYQLEGLPACDATPGNTLDANDAAPAAKKNRALVWLLLGAGGAAGAAVAASASGGEARRPVSPSRP